MSDSFLQRIVPLPQPNIEIEVIESYQVTHKFYQEVRFRHSFEKHCQWYEQVAEQNRRDLAKMQKEINFMGWFYRSRG